MKMLCTAVLLLLLAAAPALAQLPGFEQKHFDAKYDYPDFPVGETFRGKPAPVDYKSHRLARIYRTVITEGAKEGTNFAGHYIFVHWGCGSNCSASAVVDAKTGKVYEGPASGGGFDFRLDSRMLTLSPPDVYGNFNDVPSAYPELYVWNENLKKFELVQKAE
jgi:hypothetical protein